MAIILNLETSTTNCSVSIAKSGKLMALKEQDSANYSHSEQLHNYINIALKEAAISMEDLDAVAVSKGPGSYTGLRIGVSAAKGLCFSLDLPLISVPTLESMANQIKTSNGYIIPLLDARRMEVYSSVFNADHEEVRDTRAEIINEESFQQFIANSTVNLIGNGATKCKGILAGQDITFDDSIVPSAMEMCRLSFEKFQSSTFEDLAYFEPYYLKDFILQKKKKA